ncbi:hypothetical protein GCM10011335_26240 [Aureimonas glaciei]|uniref:diguanylate cyclase n=1 Tax=Aureimonas glaciei TaxID=1776957 RepID=A0A916XYN8_9HYPH|nr:hypothetical protein GCM10011335_26240 [Aureimonas glaciei]
MAEILEALWSGRDGIDAGAAMLMCDIDDFKSLNDHLGHAEGDRCLATVAGVIAESVRRDFEHVARFGGEEFLVLLPSAEGSYAMAVAERVRLSVERAALPNPGSYGGGCVTVSIGVAVRTPGDRDVSHEELQRRADAALYQAKQSGRNRVALYGLRVT